MSRKSFLRFSDKELLWKILLILSNLPKAHLINLRKKSLVSTVGEFASFTNIRCLDNRFF